MSNQARDEANANSAVLVTVGPEDFASSHPLAGITSVSYTCLLYTSIVVHPFLIQKNSAKNIKISFK